MNTPSQRQVTFLLWNRSFFLEWITADPSPWGNFTPPTKQECGETLWELEPVYDYKWILSARSCDTDKWHFLKQVVLTVIHRGPLPLRELHSTGETRVWRDPGGSWACLRPVTHECTQPEAVTDKWRLCKAGRLSYGESPRTPPLRGTSLHRRNKSVERPWGILSLFTTC